MPISIRFFWIVFCSAGLMLGCSGDKADRKLKPARFRERINTTPGALVLDVRQTEEFESGHIKDAINIPWNGNDFIEKAGLLDKNRTIFLYCLTGGRSDPAAEAMRGMGFKKIHELEGGILKWRSEGLPQAGALPDGMSLRQFGELTPQSGSRLFFFGAAWNKQSKRLYPILRKITEDPEQKIGLVSINVDTHQYLARSLRVDAIPTIMIYSNGRLIWQHTGCFDQGLVESHIPQ